MPDTVAGAEALQAESPAKAKEGPHRLAPYVYTVCTMSEVGFVIGRISQN